MSSAPWPRSRKSTCGLRGGGEQSVRVKTASLSGSDVERVVEVGWRDAAGTAPEPSVPSAASARGGYVATSSSGSPASRYGLLPGRRIVEVDGQLTPDLVCFSATGAWPPDRSSLRIKTLSWNGAPEVITLKLDRHYWPAYELQRTAVGWSDIRSNSVTRRRYNQRHGQGIACDASGARGGRAGIARRRARGVPTETVYGLGVHAGHSGGRCGACSNSRAADLDPVIVHLDSVRFLTRWARDVPVEAEKLAEAFCRDR